MASRVCSDTTIVLFCFLNDHILSTAAFCSARPQVDERTLTIMIPPCSTSLCPTCVPSLSDADDRMALHCRIVPVACMFRISPGTPQTKPQICVCHSAFYDMFWVARSNALTKKQLRNRRNLNIDMAAALAKRGGPKGYQGKNFENT